MQFRHLLAAGFLLSPGLAFAQAPAQPDKPVERPPGLQAPDQRQSPTLAVPP